MSNKTEVKLSQNEQKKENPAIAKELAEKSKAKNELKKESPAIAKELSEKKLKHGSEKALVQKGWKKEEKLAIENELANKELKKKNENIAIEKALVMKQLKRIAVEVSKEMVNRTTRKSVICAETNAKFPPAPDTIQKLSQPKNATYIALYDKFGSVLRPHTVSSVKEKIAGYLE